MWHWHELLRSFIGVRVLDICSALSLELSRALQLDDVAGLGYARVRAQKWASK